MVIDYEKILATLPQIAVRKRAEIATPEAVYNVAAEMARRGYQHSAQSLGALGAWLNGYGILLAGDVGTGKTHFFRCLPASVAILPMRECYLWGYDRLDCWLAQNADTDILVDDLGAECAANHYGSKYNAINPILERRLGTSYRTHFTTNYSSDELFAKYEDRSIVDRVFELAKPFRIAPGYSRRAPVASAANVRRMEQVIFETR